MIKVFIVGTLIGTVLRYIIECIAKILGGIRRKKKLSELKKKGKK